jgi:hypothetical protein
MRKRSETSSICKDRVAQVLWAAHILALVSKTGSHTQGQTPRDPFVEDEEEHEDVNDIDSDTERAANLAGTDDSVQRKVLDCIAQLFSPAKGWASVTATALRQREDFVEVDIARNDSFHMNNSHELPHRYLPMFASGTPEHGLYTTLQGCLSMAHQTGLYLSLLEDELSDTTL